MNPCAVRDRWAYRNVPTCPPRIRGGTTQSLSIGGGAGLQPIEGGDRLAPYPAPAIMEDYHELSGYDEGMGIHR